MTVNDWSTGTNPLQKLEACCSESIHLVNSRQRWSLTVHVPAHSRLLCTLWGRRKLRQFWQNRAVYAIQTRSQTTLLVNCSVLPDHRCEAISLDFRFSANGCCYTNTKCIMKDDFAVQHASCEDSEFLSHDSVRWRTCRRHNLRLRQREWGGTIDPRSRSFIFPTITCSCMFCTARVERGFPPIFRFML